MAKMYNLFFLKIFIVSLLYVSCDSRTFEELTESVDVNKVRLVNRNTDFANNRNEPKTLLEEPIAVLVELTTYTIDNLENNWLDYSGNISITNTVLATFDSKGLKERNIYNDTSRFLHKMISLEASKKDGKSSTMHVIYDLIQENLSRGILVLITSSKPLDEDFGEGLIESLISQEIRLMVLWTGSKTAEDYAQLKKVALATGGVFQIFSQEEDTEEYTEIISLQKSNLMANDQLAENLNSSARLQFPEESKNSEGEEPTLTLRALNQKNGRKAFVPVIVEVASGTNLEMRPGSVSQIPFTVKNNLNVPVPMVFRATFNGVVQNVQPIRTVLQPSVSATVIVNIMQLPTAQSSALGTVTLFVDAASVVTSRSALISYSSQSTNDYSPPKLQYKFDGDCSNYKEPQNCEKGHWGFEATIHDEDSGLLKVLSEPYGLVFQSEFIAGTKSPVTVYYTANCCQSKVDIWAEDLRGNHVKKSLDVFNQNLYAGEIAAIVLGVLLFVFLIIGIIVAIVLIKRRNRRNMIIPRTRGGSR